jgi:hypothetical protein
LENSVLPPTLTHILELVSRKYSTCLFYSDEGSTSTVYRDQVVQISFKTYFARPNYFRFDWRGWSPAWIDSEDFATLRWNGSQTFLQQPWDEEVSKDLDKGISCATGSSDAAASIVYPLLFMKATHNVLKLKNIKLIQTESLSNVECYVISGEWLDTERFTLWISSSDYSLLRLRRGEARMTKEFFIDYRFSSLFDQPIETSIFDFPPLRKTDSMGFLN